MQSLKQLQQYNSSHSDEDEEPVIVKQTLDAEQKNYEFPPRSLLEELSYLDEDIDSFFDESSFSTSESDYFHHHHSYITPNTSYSSSLHHRLILNELQDDDDDAIEDYMNHHNDDDVTEEQQQLLVDDSRLSPLQLPARASCSLRRQRARDLSCDSNSTVTQIIATTIPSSLTRTTDPVGPSSFLKHQSSSPTCHHYKKGVPKNRVSATTTTPSTKVSPTDGFLQRSQGLSRLDSEDELDLPIFRNESEPIMDDMSDTDSDDIHYCNTNHIKQRPHHAKIVFIKLNPHYKMTQRPCTKIERQGRHHYPSCYSRASSSHYPISDEGYEEQEEHETCLNNNEEEVVVEDEDDNSSSEDEWPMESVSVFLPLSNQEQEQMVDRDLLRNAAATRIQAAWRGYQSRKRQSQKDKLKPTQRVMIELARLCSHMHGRQMGQVHQRMDALEQRIREEQAMRMAFEKAMEEMTLLIDQQQKMLSDRIDGEIVLRDTFEQKIQMAESRLKKEIKARNTLERSMSQVLNQVQEMQQAQQKQFKEDAEVKNSIRRQLEEARYEISQLKKRQSISSSSTTKTSTTLQTKKNNSQHNKKAASSMGVATRTLQNNNNHTTTTTTTTTTAYNTITTTSLASSNNNNTASSSSTASSSTTMTPSSRRRTIVPSSNTHRKTQQQQQQQQQQTKKTHRMETITKRPTAVPRTSSRQSIVTTTNGPKRSTTTHPRR